MSFWQKRRKCLAGISDLKHMFITIIMITIIINIECTRYSPNQRNSENVYGWTEMPGGLEEYSFLF